MMNPAEEMYQEHLQELRQLAKKKGINFVDVLIRLSQAYKNPGLYLCISENAPKKEIERLENQLIDMYRVKCYENQINQNIAVANALEVAIKRDAEKYERVNEELRQALPALKTSETQQQNLTLGRKIGTAINKQRADAIKALAHQMNKDLLAHSDTARWTLEKRARHIHARLGSDTVEIEGKSYKATMANGKKYSTATIRTWITGT